MVQNYFQINLIPQEEQYHITDISSEKIVATFPADRLKKDIDSNTLLEIFKSIVHEASTDDHGTLISYNTARNRTLDTLASYEKKKTASRPRTSRDDIKKIGWNNYYSPPW